jgi:glycosyltransferase involved in cell wall biosynthesis
MYYPERHHPVFMLIDALNALGAPAEFNHRDERTLGTWGFIVNGKPVAYLIDNRHEHERVHEDPAAKELIARGTLVCCAQKPDAERIEARWLPLAATPEYLEPLPDMAVVYDATFVGYIRDDGRGQLLSLLASHYVTCVQQGVFGQDAVSAYSQARCGVNVPTQYGSPLAYDVNMRVMEIAATGVPLVTNALPELAELGFLDGETCFTYKDSSDLLNAVKKAVLAPDVGIAGRQLVMDRHTYAHRAKQVLEWLNE